MIRIPLAAIHLLALAIGLGAVWTRARGLRGSVDSAALKRIFPADNLWGLSAILAIGTGLWRLLGATEKTTAYYLSHPLFHLKMGLLVLILALEISPMVTLIKWRRGLTPDPARARRMATVSHLQAAILVVMVFVAVALARGYGARV